MGRGDGGSNLGQTQVELSGLNRVFHELEGMRPSTDADASLLMEISWVEGVGGCRLSQEPNFPSPISPSYFCFGGCTPGSVTLTGL